MALSLIHIYGSAEFTIPYDRQALADYLGVERSAMSAETGKLKKAGWIETLSLIHILIHKVFLRENGFSRRKIPRCWSYFRFSDRPSLPLHGANVVAHFPGDGQDDCAFLRSDPLPEAADEFPLGCPAVLRDFSRPVGQRQMDGSAV